MRTPFKPMSSRRGTCLVALLAVLSLTASAPASAFASPADTVTGSADEPVSTDFTISSFNALGSSHTRDSTRFATGVQRVGGVVRLLGRHHIDVVGFQEMQSDQIARFVELTDGAYDLYPGTELRRIDGENSIAWRTQMWDLVEASTVAVPYFDGNIRQMPLVKLRNKTTGMTTWFANFHNPATNRNHPGQDRWRMQAIAVEVALANTLHKTGVPVFFTGDMNERAKVFCPMTGDAPMRAARGGTNRNGVCDPAHPWYVDWVFGTKRLSFNDYHEYTGALVRRTTDHPVIVSGAHIDPARFPNATTAVPAG